MARALDTAVFLNLFRKTARRLRSNDRYGRTGHLFERRYSARLVDSDDSFEAARDYIRWNPVEAGLCKHPADWRWRGPDRLKRL